MRFHVDQTAGTRNRRVIRRVLIQPNPHKAPQPQRIRQLPGNPAFAVDALKVAQQQRPEVDPRGQRPPAILSRIELRTPSLHKLIELLRLQQIIEPLIERMSWRRRQLRMRNPDVFLLFPLLACPHRHTRILRILPVDPSNSFAYASGLTPRAARRPTTGSELSLMLFHNMSSSETTGNSSVALTQCFTENSGLQPGIKKFRHSLYPHTPILVRVRFRGLTTVHLRYDLLLC